MIHQDENQLKMTMLSLLSGIGSKAAQYINLCYLADVCSIAEFGEGSVDYYGEVFVDRSEEFLDDMDYDGWLEYFKAELLKGEQYEILKELCL